MRCYKKITTAFLLLFCAFTLTVKAQQIISIPETSKVYPVKSNDAAHPCITPGEYAFIEREIAQNCRLLHLDNNSHQRVLSTALSWPLKAAAGFTNCSYYAITAHVDQDPAATTFKDYNCGSIAYDTHTGTDIAIFPFGFYMMDNNQVEVIAAAPGTIIARADGNFDRNCSVNNLPANYVIIRHADGSTALYWHMKKNSVTSKIVGQTVVAGEYLGVVGSSGSASGPHLHFEVWSGSTAGTVIDPFWASCNILNGSTWWASQKAYTEPSVLKASVHTTDVVFPGCPTTETPNESTSYTIPFQGAGLPANAAKFYIFLRNETPGIVANLSILNPNNTVFTSWTVTSSTTHISSYWGWTKNLPLVAGTYTFKAVYNGITCSQAFDIITAAVASITASGPTTFCQGDSVILTASAGASYLWSNGKTTRSITVKSSGSYTVKVTYQDASSSTSPATVVTVNSLPVATISASGATTFCQGDSVILTSSSGSSYLWSNASTSKSITVKSAGNYSVKVTGANGCSAISTLTTVTVNSLPAATISASGSTTFCQGDSVILTSSNGSSYLWSNALTSKSITVKSAGNYSVKVTGANGCSATSTITTITVNSPPTATISASGSTTFCQGDSVILTSSSGSSYLWNNASTSKSITIKSSGGYSVKVTGANGCSATSTVTTVTVNSLPVATISTSGSTTFCQGDSVILTSSNGSSYLWSNASTSKSITVKSAGNYSVKVTGANGCSATSTVATVTVNSLPVATISASGTTTFCQGDSVILTSSSGSSYLWNNASTSKSIMVKSTGNYSVKVTGANGCFATSPITTVTVNALPAATISPSGTTTFCQGDSVILTSSTGSSYLWNNALTSKSITVKSAGNYSVKVTGANGCSATSTLKVVVVNTPQNGLAVLLRNDTLFSPYNAKNYWYLIGNPLPFDSGLYYKCRQTGIYFASGRDANGCLANSANASINCDITGVPFRSDVSLLNVYPNPTNNILNVDWLNTENGAYALVLINELGQLMLEEKDIVLHRSLHMTLSTSDLPDGIYFLVIESGKIRKTIKVNKLSQ